MDSVKQILQSFIAPEDVETEGTDQEESTIDSTLNDAADGSSDDADAPDASDESASDKDDEDAEDEEYESAVATPAPKETENTDAEDVKDDSDAPAEHKAAEACGEEAHTHEHHDHDHEHKHEHHEHEHHGCDCGHEHEHEHESDPLAELREKVSADFAIVKDQARQMLARVGGALREKGVTIRHVAATLAVLLAMLAALVLMRPAQPNATVNTLRDRMHARAEHGCGCGEASCGYELPGDDQILEQFEERAKILRAKLAEQRAAQEKASEEAETPQAHSSEDADASDASNAETNADATPLDIEEIFPNVVYKFLDQATKSAAEQIVAETTEPAAAA